MSSDPLRTALNRAIKALGTVSEHDIQTRTLFENAFVLSLLPPDKPMLTNVRARLAKHLHKKLTPPWIEKGELCEVFAVLTALWHYDPTLITGEKLAHAIQRLIASEAHIGGPYNNKERNITIADNIHIALFTRLVAKPLPNVDTYFRRIITKNQFGTTKNACGTIYLLNKIYANQELADYIARHWQQKEWNTPQRQAVALIILRGNLHPSAVKQALLALCRAQETSGFWNKESLLQTKQCHVNSNITTTALIVDALSSYQQRPSSITPSLQKRHNTVMNIVSQQCELYSETIRSSITPFITQIRHDKNYEITLLPYLFAKALVAPIQITEAQHTTLGLANTYGWIAYTIYDNFLDEEGVPAQLPVANIAMRASLDCFREVFPINNNFQNYIRKVFAEMDEANAWEIKYCRFKVQAHTILITELPKYGDCAVLSARSFAHALAPMAILAYCLPNNSHVHYVETAFRHYIIAKQLNDDLHDWQKDFQVGQASYAVTAILRDLRIQPGTHDHDALLSSMQKRFRRTTMQTLCRKILHHIKKSRQALEKSGLLRPTNDVYELFSNLELSVHHSLDIHKKTQTFTSNMKKDAH